MQKTNFKVIYIHDKKIKEYSSKELDGLSAEIECLKWCGLNLSGPVRVVRVQRIEI